MKPTFGDEVLQIESVEFLIDAMVRSQSLNDFCRAVVHSDLIGSSAQGCHVFSLHPDAKLRQVSGYGTACLDTPEELSVWDEHPISHSVRQKITKFARATEERPHGLLAIPLLKESIPIGVLTFVIDPKMKTIPIHESLMPILSKLGTYCLSTMAPPRGVSESNSFQNPRETNGEELSTRQLKILALMADGLVNVEIAKELMVSESTVRQETVRIYRALAVPNRIEAAKKARALGLIKRSSPVLEN